jgi:S-DNA-T family DNA segregation ATPase FtsK/SpoIIIE
MAGAALYLLFAPAFFGLIPGQVRWMHALPVEGLTGRLVLDTLVHYLNLPGAAIVISSMVLIALYLSTTFSFSTAQQWMAIRFAFALAWRDRFRNWRSAWAKARLEKKILAKAQEPEKKTVKRAKPREDDEERIPVPRRSAVAEATPAEQAPRVTPAPEKRTPSLWNQMPRTSIPDPEPEAFEDELAEEAKEIAPVAVPAAKAISVKGRADADARPVTLAPRSDSGFRLPPSTLLHRSDESQIVREDDLRSQARILVEKCALPADQSQCAPLRPEGVGCAWHWARLQRPPIG